jgi:hypothetical protein
VYGPAPSTVNSTAWAPEALGDALGDELDPDEVPLLTGGALEGEPCPQPVTASARAVTIAVSTIGAARRTIRIVERIRSNCATLLAGIG